LTDERMADALTQLREQLAGALDGIRFIVHMGAPWEGAD
jgi:hypothetical protein